MTTVNRKSNSTPRSKTGDHCWKWLLCYPQKYYFIILWCRLLLLSVSLPYFFFSSSFMVQIVNDCTSWTTISQPISELFLFVNLLRICCRYCYTFHISIWLCVMLSARCTESIVCLISWFRVFFYQPNFLFHNFYFLLFWIIIIFLLQYFFFEKEKTAKPATKCSVSIDRIGGASILYMVCLHLPNAGNNGT